MAFWVAFAFLLGVAVGASVVWWLLGGPSVQAPAAATTAPTSPAAGPRRAPVAARPAPASDPADEVPDSMSLTAKRLVSDLERKYEGATASDEESVAKPKRPRAKRARPTSAEDPVNRS